MQNSYKSNSESPWLSVALDRRLEMPLQGQLCSEIRRLVHAGQLVSGDRLPASRLLAGELSVSRITVVTAYEQLVSEGYLVGRPGAGMFIAPDLSGLPGPPLQRPQAPLAAPGPARAFDTAVPDVAGFPHHKWARLFDQTWRSPEPALLSRQDPFGWGPLRVAIARHLLAWRGLHCSPAQVVVTSGIGETLDLLSRTALVKGGPVVVEEPGHGALRAVLAENGHDVWPVEVDEDGLDPGEIPVGTCAVAVTPSRQYPLGMTLPLARRLGLLRWAEAEGGWVIEDDYDGEYRYHGQPLPTMMSLDQVGRVIYAGSFSKVLFSGVRLAYVVIPEALVPAIRNALERRGPRAAIVAQPVLARFMEEGLFAIHLRRMRRLYAQRQRALVAALRGECTGLLEADEGPAGMHLVADLTPELAGRMSDVDAACACASVGVQARALSGFFAGPARRHGLVLGFAGFEPSEMLDAAARMAAALRA